MSGSNFLFASLGAEVAVPPDIREHIALHRERVEHGRGAPLPAQGLRCSFGIDLSFGGVVALQDVDLAVRHGEIRAIIGRTALARVR